MTPFASLGIALVVLASVAVVSRFGPAIGDRLPGAREGWHAFAYYLATTLAYVGPLLAFHTAALGSTVAEAAAGSDAAGIAAGTTATAAAVTALLAVATRNHLWDSDAFPGEQGFVRAPGTVAERRVWVGVAAAVFLGALLFELDGWGVVALEPYWLLAGAVGLYLLYTIAVLPVQPPRNHSFSGAREPTAAERERIAACYRRFGRAPETVVVSVGENPPWVVLAAGRLAGRYLWIHESLLADASDDVLTAALAIHEERSRWWYPGVLLLPQIPAAVGSIVAGGRLVQTADPWAAVPVLLGSLAAVVVGLAVAGRISKRAEAAATEAAGEAAVRSAYEELGSGLTVVAFQRLGALPLPRWLNPETPTAWSVLRVPAKREPAFATPPGGWGWLAVGSSLLAPLGLAATEIALRVAHTEGLLSTARLHDIVEHFVPLLYVLLLLTPLISLYGLYRQRQAVSAEEWSPHLAYYATGVPLLSPLVALVYLFERAYRSHWRWLSGESASSG